jgi:hypothetical protein
MFLSRMETQKIQIRYVTNDLQDPRNNTFLLFCLSFVQRELSKLSLLTGGREQKLNVQFP